MAFIGQAVSSMRLTAQMLQKLLLEGILDQVGTFRVASFPISMLSYGHSVSRATARLATR